MQIDVATEVAAMQQMTVTQLGQRYVKRSAMLAGARATATCPKPLPAAWG